MTLTDDLRNLQQGILSTGTNVVTMAASSETGAPELAIGGPSTDLNRMTVGGVVMPPALVSGGVTFMGLLAVAGAAALGWWLWQQYGQGRGRY